MPKHKCWTKLLGYSCLDWSANTSKGPVHYFCDKKIYFGLLQAPSAPLLPAAVDERLALCPKAHAAQRAQQASFIHQDSSLKPCPHLYCLLCRGHHAFKYYSLTSSSLHPTPALKQSKRLKSQRDQRSLNTEESGQFCRLAAPIAHCYIRGRLSPPSTSALLCENCSDCPAGH